MTHFEMQARSSLHSYSKSICVRIYLVLYSNSLCPVHAIYLFFTTSQLSCLEFFMGPVVLGTTSMTKQDLKNREVKGWTVRDGLES